MKRRSVDIIGEKLCGRREICARAIKVGIPVNSPVTHPANTLIRVPHARWNSPELTREQTGGVSILIGTRRVLVSGRMDIC